MKLLGATPWFESYLVEDSGEYRLHHRYGGGSETVSASEVARITLEGGWLMVQEDFRNLEELQLRVDELAPKSKLPPEEFPVSAALARAVLPQLQELRNLDMRQRTFIEKLLSNGAVRADRELYRELEEILAR